MKEGKVNHPSHHAYEFPSDEEDRLGDLFKQLDVNGDGRIDVHDLSEGLKKLNIPQVPGYAELLIQRADVNESNDLTLAEFVNYVQEHEKRLLLVFHTLDANSDGRVDERELKSSFRLGGYRGGAETPETDDMKANLLYTYIDMHSALHVRSGNETCDGSTRNERGAYVLLLGYGWHSSVGTCGGFPGALLMGLSRCLPVLLCSVALNEYVMSSPHLAFELQ
nr:calcium-binding mitochondrial carrier protein SCaMC-3-like [Penaeus vannamei]